MAKIILLYCIVIHMKSCLLSVYTVYMLITP